MHMLKEGSGQLPEQLLDCILCPTPCWEKVVTGCAIKDRANLQGWLSTAALMPLE